LTVANTWCAHGLTQEVTNSDAMNGGCQLSEIYVSGLFMIIVGAEVVNKSLNGSVAFVKNNDVYITSDYWRTVVHFGFREYEELVIKLRTEILELQEITKLATPAVELQHLKRALNSLERKLRSLKIFYSEPTAEEVLSMQDAKHSNGYLVQQP
jgi:hypothetical protein